MNPNRQVLKASDWWAKFYPLVKARTPFETISDVHGDVSFRAVHWEDSYGSGSLPAYLLGSFRQAEYVIYWNETPIAWFGPDGWHLPDVHYGGTSSYYRRKLHFVLGWHPHGYDQKDM